MKKTDAVIIGAGSSGSYIAKLLAEQGFSVCVIESLPKKKVGTKYDIFHIEEKEFELLNLPKPKNGDPSWAFTFSENLTADPKNLYPKKAEMPVVGLHMHEYITLLNDRAAEAGAKFIYDAAFSDFIFNGDRVAGIRYEKGGKLYDIHAQVVIDCSGIKAVGRSKLPRKLGVESFLPGNEDMFYVILRYVKLKNEKDYLTGSCGWPFFKSWIAPCADPEGAIIGIGACHGFDYAETVFEEMCRHITLPEHSVERIEKGFTPYTRTPHSFVTDGFIVSGDAACLTKPLNGEGVTSSMHQLQIVVDVLTGALKAGDTSKSRLWPINVKYNRTQGAEFASLRALLVGVVNAANFDEFEFAFESGIITDELLGGGKLDAAFIASAAAGLAKGIASGKVRASTIKAALNAVADSNEAKKLYLAFPENPVDFPEWCYKANKLWAKIGKIK